jgi:inosine/xanthosine triphosphatase
MKEILHMSLRIAIGSTNPAKIKAVKTAFLTMGLPITSEVIDAPSGVPAQPLSDEQTLQGARNRARFSFSAFLDQGFDYGVGLEGGVLDTPHGMFLCNWGVVTNAAGEEGISSGIRILLPPRVAEGLRAGRELGDIMEDWTGKVAVKQQEGAIGVFTAKHITREQMFRDVIICAFSRFLLPDDYSA